MEGKVGVSDGQGKSENLHVCFERFVCNPSHIIPAPLLLWLETAVGVDVDVDVDADVDQAPANVEVASKTHTFKPLASSCRAATIPADPPPITATSIIVGLFLSVCLVFDYCTAKQQPLKNRLRNHKSQRKIFC